MVNYQYSYLIGSLIFLLIWLLMYLWRKNIRKEIWIFSLIFGVLAFPANYIYLQDWWHPLTITRTILGIEDFILGFATGGVAAVIFEDVFKKKIKIRKSRKDKSINILSILILILTLFIGSYFILGLHSFWVSLIVFGIPTLIIWLKRKDLIIDSLFSGILLVIVSFPSYWIPELISPGVVEKLWYLDKLSGIIFLGQPLEDIIWWFFAGIFIGPLYEYWQEGKLINTKR